MSHSSTDSQEVEILIVDDHRLLLNGTISLVGDRFPNAKIRSCQTVQDALSEVRKYLPDLAIVDLSLPETSGTAANVEQGLGLLKCLMQDRVDNGDADRPASPAIGHGNYHRLDSDRSPDSRLLAPVPAKS